MIQELNGATRAVERIVYVVDPAESVRRSLSALLRAHGYGVESFVSGRGLRDALASRRPDGVLIEIELPDVCGVDLAESVGRGDSPPPVIMMGSQTDALVARRVKECGAIGFLEKPFVSCALLTVLERAMKASSSPQPKTD